MRAVLFSFASLLIRQNANSEYIQERLGHGSIPVTMDIYGNVFEGEQDIIG
jgi:site-specific recombinase XerD